MFQQFRGVLAKGIDTKLKEIQDNLIKEKHTR